MIEGSGAGSISQTSGSGSRRPKNMWIRNTGGSESAILPQTLNNRTRIKPGHRRRSPPLCPGSRFHHHWSWGSSHGWTYHWPQGPEIRNKARYQWNLLAPSPTALKLFTDVGDSAKKSKWQFSSLVPKSPTRTGLICVKTLEPNISSSGPFEKLNQNSNTVQRPKIKQKRIVFLQVIVAKKCQILMFFTKSDRKPLLLQERKIKRDSLPDLLESLVPGLSL